MAAGTTTPTKAELEATLGSACDAWSGIFGAMEKAFGPLDAVWKPSKLAFGRMCLVQRKKRTLVYLLPDRGQITASIVLGERACGVAMSSSLPAAIKTLIAEARPYVEGRGIRFPVRTARDVATLTRLVEFKTLPRPR